MPNAASASGAFCLSCRYALGLSGEPRCPECGHGFDPAKPSSFAMAPSSRTTSAPWATVLTTTIVCLLACVGRSIGPQYAMIREILLATVGVGIVVLVASCYRSVMRAPAVERRRTIAGIALSVIGALVVVGLVLFALVMWALSRIGPL